MSDIILYASESIVLRASPVQNFLYSITVAFNRILHMLNAIINGTIMQEPLFLFPVGFIAIMGAVGIFKRMLSRD